MDTVLFVDDEPAIRELVSGFLGERGYIVACRERAEDALIALERSSFDVLVTDLRLQGMDGVELCRNVVAHHPGLPVILFTGFGDMAAAVEALRAGAADFVQKSNNLKELRQAVLLSIERALEHRRLGEEVQRLEKEVTRYRTQDELLGDSQAMQSVRALVDRAAASDAPVLITGETGTGKEVVARALHARSSRRIEPFVAINCAAVPGTLLDAELFGHARGAFTDAKTARRGLLIEAGRGTLLLDEVGELSLAMQPKLLRALQERRVRPLGTATEEPFECRIVAATNRVLDTEVRSGRFRQDLYYRLNVLHIDLPPLRERGTDVLTLAARLLRCHSERTGRCLGLSDAAAKRILGYGWPGNVRELENAVESAIAVCSGLQIDTADLPARMSGGVRPATRGASEPIAGLCALADLERRHIERVLNAVDGNKREAADILGLDRSTLYRKLKRFET